MSARGSPKGQTSGGGGRASGEGGWASGEGAGAGAGGPDGGPSAWRVVQGAVVILTAGYFIYSLREILNPFIVYCAFIALLIPFRGVRGHAHMVTIATVLVTLWVLHTAGSLLGPFFLAFILAYILDPLVDRVSAHPRIGRSGAILLILFPFLGIGVLIIAVALPELVQQARAIVGEVPGFVNWLREWVSGLTPETLGFDIPLVDEAALLSWAQSLDAQAVADFVEERRADLAQRAWAAVLGLGRGFGTMVTVFGYLVLTPVLMFYLLRDFDLIVARAGELVPGKLKSGANSFARNYDKLLSSYLRGQVTTSLIVGAITWVGLLIVGFPYAFLLGVTVAVLGVVPYLGLVVSLIPAIILALISESVGISLLKVAIVYGVAQGLEGAVISPRIVGESVGLHPVWILLALSLGGFYFGFVGLLIGVPVAVAIKLLLVRGVERYRRSALYKEESALSR